MNNRSLSTPTNPALIIWGALMAVGILTLLLTLKGKIEHQPLVVSEKGVQILHDPEIITSKMTTPESHTPLPTAAIAAKTDDVEKVLPLPESLVSHKSNISLYVERKQEIQAHHPLHLPRRTSDGAFEKNNARLEQEAAISRNRLIATANAVPIRELRQAEILLSDLTPEERTSFASWYDKYQSRKQLLAQGLTENEIRHLLQ